MFWSPQLSLNHETKFKLLASPQACGSRRPRIHYGGIAQTAAIEAAEIVADKALLWSTIQFVNAGLLNQSIDIEVEVLGGGRSISNRDTARCFKRCLRLSAVGREQSASS